MSERREDDGSPPTLILQSYQAMGSRGRTRLRKIGGVMIGVGIVPPMAIEPFRPLHWVYWVFAGLVALAGLCLLWPEMGLVLLDRIGKVLARFLPSKKLSDVLTPERRAGRDGEEDGDA